MYKYIFPVNILVSKTVGHCSLVSDGNAGKYSEWECGNECIPFTDQCNKTCYEDLEKCGINTGHCIPNIPHELNQYSYWSCQGQCISEKQKCNCKCPDWLDECGDKCLLPGELGVKYREYMGRCIPITDPLTGRFFGKYLHHLKE